MEIFHSRRDMYGDGYWAFQYTEHDTGKTAIGTISGDEASIIGTLRYLHGEDKTIVRISEIGMWAFRNLTKDWPYAGCAPVDIAEQIKTQLSN